MSELLQTLTTWLLGGLKGIGMQLVFSLALAVLVFGVRHIVMAALVRRVVDKSARHRWRKASSYLSIALLGLLLFPIWLPSIRNILAALGIFGAGVVIVLKEVILNLAGWFYILIRRPFEEGNRIGIADHWGDVIDIRLLEFSMLEVKARDQGGQSTGRILHIPNSSLFTMPLANASKEFSFNWNEIQIKLTLDSDWDRAATLIKQIANETLEHIARTDTRIRRSEEEYAIRYSSLTPGLYVDVRESAIVLTLRHLVEPRATRNITDELWRAILTALAKEEKIYLA